jgi:4-carboxymuconolactone decarboxylase
MHAPVAKKEGLPDDVIERIRARGDLATLPARYVQAARVVQHVLARESVPARLQDEIQQEVGVTGLIELVVLAGYYQTIAAVLFAFDVPLPEGTPAPF